MYIYKRDVKRDVGAVLICECHVVVAVVSLLA